MEIRNKIVNMENVKALHCSGLVPVLWEELYQELRRVPL
jgi:hypothetical protein